VALWSYCTYDKNALTMFAFDLYVERVPPPWLLCRSFVAVHLMERSFVAVHLTECVHVCVRACDGRYDLDASGLIGACVCVCTCFGAWTIVRSVVFLMRASLRCL